MIKDELGKRMKENYENRAKTYLTRRMPVILRLDGCHFKNFCKKMKKPYDQTFAMIMQQTTKYLCENIQGVKLGYTQSDEISLLLVDYDNLDTDAWYDYNVQKLCSVSASMATVFFNNFINQYCDTDYDEKRYTSNAKEFKEAIAHEALPTFDSRCFNIPKEEVCNYFIWRQMDAIRNSKASLAQAFYSQKELNNLSAEQMIEKVKAEKNIDWYKLEGEQKWGTVVIKPSYIGADFDNSISEGFIRRLEKLFEGKVWLILTDAPQFKENREVIEKLINPEVEE